MSGKKRYPDAALTVTEYTKARGTRCPACKGENLSGAEVTTGNGWAEQAMSCDNCSGTWLDRYTLTGYGCLEVPKDDASLPRTAFRVSLYPISGTGGPGWRVEVIRLADSVRATAVSAGESWTTAVRLAHDLALSLGLNPQEDL